MQRSNLVRDRDGWKTIGSQTHLERPHLTVVSDHVVTPTHQAAREWLVVHRKAAVVIAPMTAAGRFVLIREERIPIRAAIWCMPAGQIDESHEPEEEAIRKVALRELREETGYELAAGGDLVSLGYFFSSPGFTDEHCYLFLARPVEKHPQGPKPDGAETIVDCREFSPDLLREMIAEGEVQDSNTLSIWARLVARGDIAP